MNRVYTGGKLFADFFGDDSTDGFFPEEWIASSVVARNKEMITSKDGVSKPEGMDIYFEELLSKYTAEMLGPTGKTDKDAIERLMCSLTPKVGDVFPVPALSVID